MGLLLTIKQLFTPAPATPQQVSPTTPGTDWLTKMMQVCTRLQLQVTDWNSGGVARTIMTVVSWMLSTQDALISGIAQGGFLDYAATGVVTYVDPDDGVTVITVPVTVDPSTNPGAAPGWLDLVADSGYNVQRISAAGGVGLEIITNTTGNAYSYPSGTFHVSNLANGLAYSNVALLTIAAATVAGTSIASIANTSPMAVATSSPHGLATGAYVTLAGVVGYVPGVGSDPNATYQVRVTSPTTFLLVGSTASGAYGAGGLVFVAQAAQFSADIDGPGTSGPGTITNAITGLPGVSVTNLVAFVGTAAESNVALAARCRLKLASLSPNGAKAAYQYFALSAYQLANPSPAAVENGALRLISEPITKVLVGLNTNTGVVQVTVANASGPVTGVVDLPVLGASFDTPIVIMAPAFTAQQLPPGATVSIEGVEGNFGANGIWQISILSTTTFALNGSVGNGVYAGGGVIEGGDLGELDAFLQTTCVPASVTEATLAATNVAVSSSATVYVTASYASQVPAAIAAALAAYATSLPIGGLTLPGEGTNIAPYDAILTAMEAALPQIQNITNLLLNGGTSDISVGTMGILSFGVPSLTIVGV